MQALEALGAQVFLPSGQHEGGCSGQRQGKVDAPPGQVNWGPLAGYEQQKQMIRDTLLLPLRHPEVYDKVAAGTRATFESNRPRVSDRIEWSNLLMATALTLLALQAVLFEGPPGTGKTSMARVLADEVNVPLVYLPLESIVSKYYGEGEKRLGQFFANCEDLGEQAGFLNLTALARGTRARTPCLLHVSPRLWILKPGASPGLLF